MREGGGARGGRGRATGAGAREGVASGGGGVSVGGGWREWGWGGGGGARVGEGGEGAQGGGDFQYADFRRHL